MAIAEGRVTPIQAFFRALAVVYASAENLSIGYRHAVRMPGIIKSSPALQQVVADLNALCRDH